MTAKNDHHELIDQLTEGIADLTSSESWQHYLDFQSRFHRYSFGNVLLIAAQCHEATRVAGFNAWRKMNRFVRKGEKAIWILAPMVYKNANANANADADADDGENNRVIRGFKFVPVFDVAQTDGEELPSICNRIEGEDPAGHYAQLVTVAQSIGFTVEDHAYGGSTNGDCSHREHRIRVEAHNTPAQRVKTLAHELGHAILHAEYDSRPVAELEAESVAFIVCANLGITSDDYSFGYVAIWAGGGDEAQKAIKESGGRIQRAAEQILSTIEPATSSVAA